MREARRVFLRSEQAEVKVVSEEHQRLRYPLESAETNRGTQGYQGALSTRANTAKGTHATARLPNHNDSLIQAATSDILLLNQSIFFLSILLSFLSVLSLRLPPPTTT